MLRAGRKLLFDEGGVVELLRVRKRLAKPDALQWLRDRNLMPPTDPDANRSRIGGAVGDGQSTPAAVKQATDAETFVPLFENHPSDWQKFDEPP